MNAHTIERLFEASNMISLIWNHVKVVPGNENDIDTKMVQDSLSEIDKLILAAIPDDWEAIVAKSEGRFLK